MPAWDPNPKVTIGGVDYTSETINRVSVTMGRTTVDDQPRAGYATISLIILNNTYPTIELNSPLYLTIEDSSANEIGLFNGYITDITRTIDKYGVVGQAVRIDITAAGPLSRLSKLLTASNYEKEYDGDRITQILEDAFATAWNEVNALLQWEDVDPAKTWLTYDPGYVGTVETPGDYELTEYSGGAVEALSLCRLTANSALGVLYERGDGLIHYDAATTRIDRVVSDGFLELSADYITASNVASSSTSGDLINNITIKYKNNQSVTGEDVDSVLTYGLFSGSRNTYLELGAQAEQQRDFFLTTRALPRVNLSSISIPLHNSNLGNTLRDDLIGIYTGTPISVPDLPTAIYNAPFSGFVEGISWLITRYTTDLTLNVSEYGLSAIEQAWQQVNAAETWQTISTTLTWENATVVN